MDIDKKKGGTEATPLRTAHADGRWSTGMCECWRDPGMCCMVTLCDPILTGQLYERAARQGLIERAHASWTCVSISAFLFTGYLLSELLADTNNVSCISLAGLVGLASSICTLLIVCTVRKSIRTRDNIEAGHCCGEAEDCCCAFWCSPFVQCQIWRHEAVRFREYRLCSPTATPVDDLERGKVQGPV